MSWLPNWLDPDRYPAERLLSDWRWQFTRRREDYQADWEIWSQTARRPLHEEFMPPPEGHESWEDVVYVTAQMPGCEERYGMLHLVDPALEHVPHAGVFSVGEGTRMVFRASFESFEEFNEKRVRLCTFDLNKPIPPQIERVKKMLLDEQAELELKPTQRRLHLGKLPLYLRILDARTSGVTFEEIGETLLATLEEASFEKGGSDLAARAHQIWTAARNLMFNWPA